MTRLLKTPIIGRIAAVVDSSRSDMLAGLSKCEILRTPPGFSANAASPANNASQNEPAPASTRRPRFILQSLDLTTRALARITALKRLPQIETRDKRQSRRAPPA